MSTRRKPKQRKRKLSKETVQRALARRRQIVRAARASPATVAEFCFDRPDGHPVCCGDMHHEWCELAAEHDRLLIVAPRGHMKTELMVVAHALWILGTQPDALIKIICQSDAKAVKRLAVIRDHLQNNARLHLLFPHLHPDRQPVGVDWNKHMITVARSRRSPDPSIEALGITSSASGDRATHILADDVVDRRNAITMPAIRDAIRASWDDWVNLLLPGGRILYICTLWHSADLTHDLLKSKSWSVAWYAIDFDTLGSYVKLPDGTERRTDRPLWGRDDDCPDHGVGRSCECDDPSACGCDDGDEAEPAICSCGPWSREALRARCDELTPPKFKRGFCHLPMSDSDTKIDPSWVRYYGTLLDDGTLVAAPTDDLPRVVALDLAQTKGKKSDYTGLAVAALDFARGRILIEVARHYKLTFPQKAQLVRECFAQYRPEHIVVESAAGGVELVEYLNELAAIMPIRTVSTKQRSKGMRLERVSPYIYRGAVWFHPALNPDAGLVSREYGEAIAELLGETSTDDILDAIVHLIRFVTVYYAEHFAQAAADDIAAQHEQRKAAAGAGDGPRAGDSRILVF